MLTEIRTDSDRPSEQAVRFAELISDLGTLRDAVRRARRGRAPAVHGEVAGRRDFAGRRVEG